VYSMLFPVPVMVPLFPLTLPAVQVTPVLLAPVAVAVRCAVPPTGMLLLAGLIETVTSAGAVTVTVALAVFAVLALLVAVTVQVFAMSGAV